MFARVTMGFGAVLIAASGLAAAAGSTTSTAIIPAILGGLFIILGLLDRRYGPTRSVRQRSPSLFATIVAGALVFSSARGITLIADALRANTTPSVTAIFLFGMVVAGVGYIVFGAWWDFAEARRIGRARAAAAVTPRSNRSGR